MTKVNDNDILTNLLARCAIKDQNALKELYSRIGGYLNSVAYRIVQDSETSNEVLQEAFIQIWQNASNYRADQAKALTWMTSIVRYRAIDRKEKEKKHSTKTLDDEHLELEASPNECPEQMAVYCQVSNQLADCMNQLDEKIKKCIELAYLYGLSREEIAAHKNTTVNTIKSWLHRGAKTLKECLTAKQGGLL